MTPRTAVRLVAWAIVAALVGTAFGMGHALGWTLVSRALASASRMWDNGAAGTDGRTVPRDSASIFFLIPKAARSDREPVLGGLAERNPVEALGATVRLSDPRMDRPQIRRPRANVHPTVKPVDLMRHLVRLVTPPGGTVLDPFLGSGTTALAAEMEGFAWIC